MPKPWTHDGVFYHAQYALTGSQFQSLVQGPGPAIGGELPDHTAESEGRYNLILAHQPAVGDLVHR